MASQNVGTPHEAKIGRSEGRDVWDLVSIVASVLVPVMVAVAGYWVSHQQKEANVMARQADRLSLLIGPLASENPRERKIAVGVSSYLLDEKQLPPELAHILLAVADSDESAEVAKAAGDVVAKLKALDPGLVGEIDEDSSKIPPRLYFHINLESQRIGAKALAAELLSRMEPISLKVPGIERKSGPSGTELRYFNEADGPEADTLGQEIRRLGVDVAVMDLSKRYRDANIRPRHYKLWLGNEFSWETP